MIRTEFPRTPSRRSCEPGPEGPRRCPCESGAARGSVTEGRTAPVQWARAPRGRRALTRSWRACASSPARAQRQHAEVRHQARDVPEGPLRVADRRLDLVLGEVLGPEVDGHLAPVDRRVALAIRHGWHPFALASGTTPSLGVSALKGSRSHHWLLPPRSGAALSKGAGI